MRAHAVSMKPLSTVPPVPNLTRTLRCSAAAVVLASWLAAPCLSQEQLNIEVVRVGDYITVTASAELQANPRIAWEVLSDYDDLARFIPDIRSSRVLRRDADGPVVEQKGEFGFLFFRQAIEVIMAVREEPPRRIVARAISGNMKDMEGRYELLPSLKGVRLAYYGRFVPDFFVPPLIGMPIVRRSLERRFRAMAEEIERRDALARDKAGR